MFVTRGSTGAHACTGFVHENIFSARPAIYLLFYALDLSCLLSSVVFSTANSSALHGNGSGNFTRGETEEAGFEVVKSLKNRSKQDRNLWNVDKVRFCSSAHYSKVLFNTDTIVVHVIHVTRNTEKL